MIRVLPYRLWRSLGEDFKTQYTAWEHRGADLRCGRRWVCTCGACRLAREAAR